MEKKHEISMSLLTLNRWLKEYDLKKYTNNHDQVRQIIRTEVAGPSSQCGYRKMWNKLRTTYGINIPRDAAMKILREVDPTGTAKRKGRKLIRRTYISSGPNCTWHTDGYDKLKPFGLPIHGCVDGFSRKCLWLKVVGTNKNPVVPASFYISTVDELGLCPALARTDCGTENGQLSAIQCAFIDNKYGNSHANQRIENWWSHCRKGYSGWVINFFKELVDSGKLIPGHFIIKEEWNNRYIRRSNFTQISGVPDELLNFPETRGYTDQGVSQSKSDIELNTVLREKPRLINACGSLNCSFIMTSVMLTTFITILNEMDEHSEAEEALNVDDEDLFSYFNYIVRMEGLTYPPGDWKSAKELFETIIERSKC